MKAVIECDECSLRELANKSVTRFMLVIGFRFIFAENYGVPVILNSHANTVRAMLGQKILTHHERHREAFIETGNPIEYDRMLRTVELEVNGS